MPRSKRKTISPRVRFEIFKRDGFSCVYCKATPETRPMHVEHVLALANGGDNGSDNLVTACSECNAGKGAIRLEDHKFSRPDTSPEKITESKEHIKQLKEFLKYQKELDEARMQVVYAALAKWRAVIGDISKGTYARLPGLIREWGYERLVQAIDITGGKLRSVGDVYDEGVASSQTKYLYGILRRWRADGAVTNLAITPPQGRR